MRGSFKTTIGNDSTRETRARFVVEIIGDFNPKMSTGTTLVL